MLRDDHRAAPAPDPEALIAEARRRQRKRWLGIAALVAVVGLAVAPIVLLARPSGNGTGDLQPGAGAAPRTPATVTLVYAVRVGRPYPGDFDENPVNSWVWRSNPDGSHAVRLARGTEPSISPNGRLVAFTRYARRSGGRRETLVIPITGGVARRLAVPWGFRYAWAPDSSVLVGSDPYGHAYTVDPASGDAVGIPEACRVQGGAAFAGFKPAGDAVLMQCGGSLTAYDPATQQKTPVAPGVRFQDNLIAWGPQWIAFSRGQGSPNAPRNIWLVRPDGSGLHQLTHVKSSGAKWGIFPVAWTADGQTILAETTSIQDADTWVVDARTGQARIRLPGVNPIALSRDGKTILAAGGCAGEFAIRGRILSAPLAGGKTHRIATGTCWADWNA